MTDVASEPGSFARGIAMVVEELRLAEESLNRIRACYDPNTHMPRLRDLPGEIWAAMPPRVARALASQRNPSREFEGWRDCLRTAYWRALTAAQARYLQVSRHLVRAEKDELTLALRSRASASDPAADARALITHLVTGTQISPQASSLPLPPLTPRRVKPKQSPSAG